MCCESALGLRFDGIEYGFVEFHSAYGSGSAGEIGLYIRLTALGFLGLHQPLRHRRTESRKKDGGNSICRLDLLCWTRSILSHMIFTSSKTSMSRNIPL